MSLSRTCGSIVTGWWQKQQIIPLLKGAVMKRIAVVIIGIAAMMLMCISVVFAQDTGTATTSFNWLTLAIALGTPLAVFGATWLVTTFGPTIPGTLIVSVVVPLMSALTTGITQWIDSTAISPTLQGVLGLVAVFLSQILIQFKKTQTS
jgi:hypothetical protein